MQALVQWHLMQPAATLSDLALLLKTFCVIVCLFAVIVPRLIRIIILQHVICVLALDVDFGHTALCLPLHLHIHRHRHPPLPKQASL